MKKIFFLGAIGALIEASPIMGLVMIVMAAVLLVAIPSYYFPDFMGVVIWTGPISGPALVVMAVACVAYISGDKKSMGKSLAVGMGVGLLLWFPYWLLYSLVLQGYMIGIGDGPCPQILLELPAGERMCESNSNSPRPPFFHFNPDVLRKNQ